jgi:hypothetical protein
MAFSPTNRSRLSELDLDFLVKVVSPGVADREGLKRIIQEDQDFR